jgi:hypothetical protein
MRGRLATFPDEYAERLGLSADVHTENYTPEPFLFDYQKDITRMAVERQRFALFVDCGLGKTAIQLSYARHVRERLGPKKRILIITPPLVVPQLAGEAVKFWGDDLPVEIVKAKNLAEWITGTGDAIGVTNYEALKEDTPQGNLGCLILDESSILKSHYGNYAKICLRLGANLPWKLCGTGTPAPNDRIEYANHAVFLDRFPNVNSFLATYFVNRGQTGNRWELRPHALRPFYRALSHWCIFLTDPSVYGWQDNCATIPPIHVHIHDVPLTDQQRSWVHSELGTLVPVKTGGITARASFGQVSKGEWKGQKFETNKYKHMRSLVDSWDDSESTLIWCLYNHEQRNVERAIPYAKSMDGTTPMWKRQLMIDWFQQRICDCEYERRIKCGPRKKKKNTCDDTTKPTNINGTNAHGKNRTNTTASGERNTQRMKGCEEKHEGRHANGKMQTQKNDSHNVCENTELPRGTTTRSLTSKRGDAQSADSPKNKSGTDACTSTIATTPDKSGDCCAASAISQLESSATGPTSASPLLNTCCCTPEQKTRGRVLVSKPSVLGFGLNLQKATRQIFSGLQDSYESYYQCVKRSNRIGSTKPLNVHIPVTELEYPMVENVLRKADRVESDAREQEQLFREAM